MALEVTLFLGLGTIALMVGLIVLRGRQLSRIIERDQGLELEIFGPKGRKGPLIVPKGPPTGWVVTTRTGPKGGKYFGLAVVHEGIRYDVPLVGAEIVDLPALTALAPAEMGELLRHYPRMQSRLSGVASTPSENR